MCSVIEIKNANEYYIHYHSPESLNPNEVNNKMEAGKEQMEKLKKTSKDSEVTSDRGSSASPSLEDEEEQTKNEQVVALELKSPGSKIPVRKKLPAPQPPTKKKAPSPPKNPFIEDQPSSGPKEQPFSGPTKQSSTRLPRPKSATNSSKLTSARSLESVPITVNSHIPASPLRMPNHKKVVGGTSKVTSEMGTQVEHSKKSVSVENLSHQQSILSKSSLLLRKTSESSDQIVDGKKWSYTNGKPQLLHLVLMRKLDLFLWLRECH